MKSLQRVLQLRIFSVRLHTIRVFQYAGDLLPRNSALAHSFDGVP
jgi:hypothetical protein